MGRPENRKASPASIVGKRSAQGDPENAKILEVVAELRRKLGCVMEQSESLRQDNERLNRELREKDEVLARVQPSSSPGRDCEQLSEATQHQQASPAANADGVTGANARA